MTVKLQVPMCTNAMRLLSTIQVAADEGDSSETCILLKVPKGQVPVYSESMSSYGAS